MPIGVYVNDAGEERELILRSLDPIVIIGGETFRRVLAPQRITYTGTKSEPTAQEQVRATCYDMELSGKWKSGYTKSQMKKAWNL